VNFRPKLIATDLDGTIVTHDFGISQETIATFTKAHQLGIEIFFVTGRPPRWMVEISETFSFGSAICGNGAMLYDLRTSQVIEQWLIPVEAQVAAVKKLREVIPNVAFAIENHSSFHREATYIPRWDIGLDSVGVPDILSIMTSPTLKILVRCPNYELSSDQMLEIASKEVGDLVNVTHSNPNESLLEISALGVSKGETLAKLAKKLGINSEDCISFGDNPNDFSMLSWCGRSYAMADGHPDGIKYATALAPASTEHGVSQIIEELLQLPSR